MQLRTNSELRTPNLLVRSCTLKKGEPMVGAALYEVQESTMPNWRNLVFSEEQVAGFDRDAGFFSAAS
ncbi:MAG: hypothetical protein ACRD5G_02810 [Candidatus Acidiferrales bacterium]